MIKKIYKIFIIITFLVLFSIFTDIIEVQAEGQIKIIYENANLNNIQCCIGEIISLKSGISGTPNADGTVMSAGGCDYNRQEGLTKYDYKAESVGIGWISIETDKSVRKIEVIVIDSSIEGELQEKQKELQKKQEELQKQQEKLSTFFNKDVKQITNPADRLMYLRSIIYNDKQNNNNNLWNAFVSNTEKNEREEWYKNITYSIRSSSDEIQTAEDKLKAQIDLDNAQTEEEKNKVQKQFDIVSNKAATTQENVYKEISAQLANVTELKDACEKILKQGATAEGKELIDKINDTQQIIADIKNAYKKIPSIDASAEEIEQFIQSDATYNNLENLKTVRKEKAEKWRETIEKKMELDRKRYELIKWVLDIYITDGDIEQCIKFIKQDTEEAVKATEDTINGYRKVLASLDPTTSSSRQNVTFDDVLKNIDGYIPGDTISGSDAQKITGKASLILSVITNIGIVLAILIPAILGIKYMLGSVEEKAEYKKDLLPYFIGSILLFGICAIVKVLQTIGQSINNI